MVNYHAKASSGGGSLPGAVALLANHGIWKRAHRGAQKRPFLLGEDGVSDDGTRERRTGTRWTFEVGMLRPE